MQMDQPIGSPHLAKNPKKRTFWETERVWKPLGPAGCQFRDSLSGRFCFLKSIKYIVPTLFCNPPRHRSLERFPPDGQAGLRDRLSSIRSEQPASSDNSFPGVLLRAYPTTRSASWASSTVRLVFAKLQDTDVANNQAIPCLSDWRSPIKVLGRWELFCSMNRSMGQSFRCGCHESGGVCSRRLSIRQAKTDSKTISPSARWSRNWETLCGGSSAAGGVPTDSNGV